MTRTLEFASEISRIDWKSKKSSDCDEVSNLLLDGLVEFVIEEVC